VKLAGLGRRLEDSKNGNQKSGFDWSKLDKLSLGYQGRLEKWRSLSHDFVKLIVDVFDWIRIREEFGKLCWAFPVQKNGQIQGCHYRPINCEDGKKPRWKYFPTNDNGGPGSQPWILGNIQSATYIHLSESTWDGFSLYDITGAYRRNDICVIITRGAEACKSLKGLVPPRKKIYAWMQNDPPNGKDITAAESWLKGIETYLKLPFHRVDVPKEHADLNDWIRVGATREDITQAIHASTLIDRLCPVPIYYDSPRLTFWVESNRNGWIRIKDGDVKRWLAEKGYKTTKEENQNISEVDVLINDIQRSNDVDYADSLAGHHTGLYLINERRILVRDSPKLIEPAPGDWGTLKVGRG